MAVQLDDFLKLKWYYQVLIVGGVCSGMLALVWYQFLTPIQDEITTKTAQYGELQKTIAKSLQQRKLLSTLKAESEELQVRLDRLKTVLPLEKETDEVLRLVQQSASSSGLRIQGFSFRPTIDHEVYTEWPVDMEVVGRYHDIGTFLDKIRQLPRIVNISGLKIQSRASAGDAPSTASVSTKYTATTFVYREDKLASSAPPPKTVK